MSYENCPKTHWDNGRRRCPHGCGVQCRRNAQKRKAQGKLIEKRLENLTRDDVDWLFGIGRYGQ